MPHHRHKNGPLAKLYQFEKESRTWSALTELLNWDESTYLPAGAVENRAQTKAFVAAKAHALTSSDEFGRALEDAERGAELAPDSWEAADLREWRRRRQRACLLPPELVANLAQATTQARNAWVKARAENRFVDFIEPLSRVVELKREEATRLADGKAPYEALIDLWEPGMKCAQIDQLFAELKGPSLHLLEQIAASPLLGSRSDLLDQPGPAWKQKALGKKVASAIGFDFSRGRLDATAHPFCMRLGENDVRLTTRYDERQATRSLFTVLHEAGHGLYEQGVPREHYYRPSGGYCSLGIHESQSRLWENGVGRSPEFIEYVFPQLREAYGGWAGTSVSDFVRAVNRVTPSLIRVESDEVTYNLHIMIRYEIEADLVGGTLGVREIPERWNEAYRQYLKIVPENDSVGCLQDIHWSYGLFGYFPTYTLGNLYSAQFLAQASRDIPQLTEGFRRGDFAPLLNWLREKVHAHGRRYSAEKLSQLVTGGSVSTGPFLHHLKAKFGPMYALH